MISSFNPFIFVNQDISIDGGQTEIPENEPSFIIGALQTTDEDEGDTFTYHVISHWELFRIRGNKLEVASPLDYEEKSQYRVTIKSTDNGGLSFSKSFIFKVLNLNEKPNNISLNPKEVRYFAKNEFFVLKLYMYTMKWLNLGSGVFKGSNILPLFNTFSNKYIETW